MQFDGRIYSADSYIENQDRCNLLTVVCESSPCGYVISSACL